MSAESFLYSRCSDEVGHSATVTVATGVEDSQFPASYISDWTNEHHTTPAKVTGTGAAAWLFDWTTAQRVDWVVVWGNFDPGATVTFSMGSTTATTDVSGSVIVPARTLDGFSAKYFIDLTTQVGSPGGYTTTGYRYGKLAVSAATVPAGVKLLVFSHKRQLDCNMQPEPHLPNSERSIVASTDFGHEWVYRLFAAKRDLLATALPSSQDLVDLRAWFQDCGGHYGVSALAFDPDVNDVLIVRWKAEQGDGLVTSRLDPAMFYQHAEIHPVSLQFEEITAGLPEWT